jgi:hypothetical protein
VNRILLIATATVALGACAESRGDPELLLPADVPVQWDASWNDSDDGLGALVPVDVMVYDSATGAPMGDVSLTLSADHDGAWWVSTESVEVVEPDECLGCEVLWDATRDQFVRVDAVDDPRVDGDAIELDTDPDGVARLYLVVDAFPADGIDDDPMPVVVLVSMEMADGTFLVTPR